MKRIALLSIMMLIALCSQAQIYSSEACFYLKAGENPKSAESVWKIIIFKGNKAMEITNTNIYHLQHQLKKDPNYYEKEDWGNDKPYIYDSSSSTSTEYIYTRRTETTYRQLSERAVLREVGWHYIMKVSKDNSYLIIKSKNEKQSDYTVTHYVRVPKSEVLPVSNGFIE